MTNQEILEKAIQKAIDGGWTDKQPIGVLIASLLQTSVANYPAINGLIFNHDFAKALWGDEDDDYRCSVCGTKMKHSEDCPFLKAMKGNWISPVQYHLQQMVIADDPIAYLEEHLND